MTENLSKYKLVPESIVDELAQFIRQVDGNNKMGAGALADKICERFRVVATAVQGEPVFMWHRGATDDESEVVDVDCACPCCVPLYTAPQPSEQQPDVTQLVEALERFVEAWTDCQQQPVHAEEFEILTDICEDSMKALAAHHKGGKA